MVKRACPFSDDRNRQMKFHASEKEVAEGVLRDLHMKNVYDRTKDLLFRGAKRLSDPLEPNLSLNDLRANKAALPMICCSATKATSFRQMHLTCQGQLSAPNNIVIRCEQAEVAPKCSKCLTQDISEYFSCFFCDLSLCSTCIQNCCKCLEKYCAACSFNVYDGQEGYICKNCF